MRVNITTLETMNIMIDVYIIRREAILLQQTPCAKLNNLNGQHPAIINGYSFTHVSSYTLLHHPCQTSGSIFLQITSLAWRIDIPERSKLTIAGTLGCGTASNLWKSSLYSGPMLIYAPLFSVLSQYRGAEKTRMLCLVRLHVAQGSQVLTRYTSSIVLHLITFHSHLMTPNNCF
jgi:hypothetical protein